jgi:paraquat-inducible protein A
MEELVSVMAARAGFASCDLCGLLNRRQTDARARPACARCGTRLRARKPDSIARTWALLIAAYVLYVPANVLPVLETQSLGDYTADTILGGALRLWSQGAWPLSLVIIVASFAVPLAKMFVLTWLLVSAAGEPGGVLRRTRLYRVVDFIGRWSMVDLYVGGLLVALVQFRPFADVAIGPAAPAFATVVVLTMLASRSFDPRLLSDGPAAARRSSDHG